MTSDKSQIFKVQPNIARYENHGCIVQPYLRKTRFCQRYHDKKVGYLLTRKLRKK